MTASIVQILKKQENICPCLVIFFTFTLLFNSSKHTETELVFSLKKGEEKAYSYLYDQYSPALYGVILRVVNMDSLAQDILQEVFVKIFRNMDSYQASKGRLYTWMLQIARNSAIDKLRSKDYKNALKNYSLDNDVNINTMAFSNFPSIDHIGLKKVLDALDESHQKIIELAYFKGYSQKEIAKELSLPLGTVKTRTRNALIQLRKVLNIS